MPPNGRRRLIARSNERRPLARQVIAASRWRSFRTAIQSADSNRSRSRREGWTPRRPRRIPPSGHQPVMRSSVLGPHSDPRLCHCHPFLPFPAEPMLESKTNASRVNPLTDVIAILSKFCRDTGGCPNRSERLDTGNDRGEFDWNSFYRTLGSSGNRVGSRGRGCPHNRRAARGWFLTRSTRRARRNAGRASVPEVDIACADPFRRTRGPSAHRCERMKFPSAGWPRGTASPRLPPGSLSRLSLQAPSVDTVFSVRERNPHCPSAARGFTHMDS